MKRLLLLPLLLLSACASTTPLVIFIQRDGPDLIINAPAELHGDLSRPNNGVGLLIDGTPTYTLNKAGLRLCAATNTPGSYACNLGTIPAGKFRLAAASGTPLNAQGFAYIGTSPVPVPIVLP